MRGRAQVAACVLAAVAFTTFATAAPDNKAKNDDAKLRAYGKHLSPQCTTCHRIDGADNGVPSIVGWPAEDFVFVLKAYKDGGRSNPEMVTAARQLNDEQMQALASFFGSLKTRVRLR